MKSRFYRFQFLSIFRKLLIILFIIFTTFLGFYLRDYAANRKWLVADEKIYLQAARQYNLFIRNGQFNQFIWYKFNFEHPPLHKIVYGFALLKEPPLENFEKSDFIFGIPLSRIEGKQYVMAARNVSILFGTFTVAILSIVNPIAGLFFATHTFAVNYNSSMFLESIPIFFSFLSVYYYQSGYKKTIQNNKYSDLIYFGISSLFLGIAIACKFSYACIGLAIVIHFLGSIAIKKNSISCIWRLGLWGLGSLFFFILFDPFLWVHPYDRILEIIGFFINHGQSDVVSNANYPIWQPIMWFTAPFSNFFDYTLYDFIIKPDVLISILALIGLPRLALRNPLFFIWLISGLVILFIFPVKWPQYIMMIIIPYCLSASMGLGSFFDLIKKIFGSLTNKSFPNPIS